MFSPGLFSGEFVSRLIIRTGAYVPAVGKFDFFGLDFAQYFPVYKFLWWTKTVSNVFPMDSAVCGQLKYCYHCLIWAYLLLFWVKFTFAFQIHEGKGVTGLHLTKTMSDCCIVLIWRQGYFRFLFHGHQV